MKLNALSLLAVIIGSTIAPILSISLPAHSQPTSISPIVQIDETIDFGTLKINGIWKERQIEVADPDDKFKLQISPNETSPFKATLKKGFIQKRGTVLTVIVDRNAPVGNHQKVIKIKNGKQTIKTVLLKVKIIPNQPTESKANTNNSINPAVIPGKQDKK
jgi:hypothetical protein